MRYIWARKSVDIATVISAVKTFFAERGFIEAQGLKLDKKKNTLLFEIREKGKFRSMKVDVLQKRDGFELRSEGDPVIMGDTLAKLGTLSTLFGGGLLVRRKLEGADPSFYERLESDLIDYVERKMEKQGY
jgi:hypothetical protein